MSQSHFHSKSSKLAKACLLLALSYSIKGNTADFNYSVGVSSELQSQTISALDEGRNIDSDNILIVPTLALDYNSKRLQGFWRASHNHIQRSLGESDISQNFTNYTYGAQAGLIENVLTLSSSGALTYRSPRLDNFFVDDFLLNSENLSKVRTNQTNLGLELPRGDYFGIDTNLSFSNTESEQNETGFSGFDSQRYAINTQAVTGSNFTRLFGRFSSNVGLSKRDNNQGDFFSRQIFAEISYNVISRFGVAINYSNEGNQINNDSDTFSNIRNFSTFGAGLTWREGLNRFITLSYNTVDRSNLPITDDDTRDENQDFVGIDLQWQFTPRTQLSARYTKRFFGDSGEFSFSHRIRRLRTQISYTEEVTSFSNLIASPPELGVFVCADGARDLSSCFQPDSINFTLNPNQEFVQFSTQNTAISDEIILRKALSWQLGVSQRRTNFSLNGRYSTNEHLESTRFNRTYSTGIVFGFSLGSKTQVTWNADYAVLDNRVDLLSSEAINVSSTLRLSRELGKHLSLSINLRYLDQDIEGDFIGGNLGVGIGGIQGDLIDRRIGLSLEYNIGSRS